MAYTQMPQHYDWHRDARYQHHLLRCGRLMPDSHKGLRSKCPSAHQKHGEDVLFASHAAYAALWQSCPTFSEAMPERVIE